MPLGQLIGDIYQNGFGQGIANYVGNNTNFGQDINAVGNMYQKSQGNPQTQLIGNPQTPEQIANPWATPLPVNQPPSRGDVLQKYLNNQGPQFNIQQPNYTPPPTPNTQIMDLPDPSQSQGKSSSGTGKDVLSLLALT
jgi:hypothetical protein